MRFDSLNTLENRRKGDGVIPNIGAHVDHQPDVPGLQTEVPQQVEKALLDLLQKPLTDDAMQELDARVDLDKKDPAEVAKEYLSETGLVK